MSETITIGGMRVKERHLVPQDWLDKQGDFVLATSTKKTKPNVNPCLAVFGPGAGDAMCKTCVHLITHQMAKRYLKCDKRKFTRGPGSDHKASWPACGQYQPGRKS